MNQWHLAVDIGASSGKALAGKVENGRIILQEIYRFPNQTEQKNGHLCWQIDELAKHVIASLKASREKGILPSSVGIDTWGVDFVLLNAAGQRISDAVCYRDRRTEKIKEELAAEGILTSHELYQRTGIQYQPFNTIYQLAALKKEHPEQLEQAGTFLMIPDYLNYILSGIKANEYTNASTTSLVNPDTRQWDRDLLQRIGMPQDLFLPLQQPSSCIGRLKKEIQDLVGFDCDVILPATHDTGSAFAAVPSEENSVFLSSGTWSLLGVENSEAIRTEESRQANFTNEGGCQNTIRYLKNIMGLWMIQSVRRQETAEQGREVTFPELIAAAEEADQYPGFIDVDDSRFLAPSDMKKEIVQACIDAGYDAPKNTGEIMQCIYQSLAEDYAKAIRTLQELTGRKYTCINIVGGGCQDMYLNQLTANRTGIKVLAGPVEGTALGSLIVQFIHDHDFKNIQEARNAIRSSFDIKEVRPQ